MCKRSNVYMSHNANHVFLHGDPLEKGINASQGCMMIYMQAYQRPYANLCFAKHLFP